MSEQATDVTIKIFVLGRSYAIDFQTQRFCLAQAFCHLSVCSLPQDNGSFKVFCGGNKKIVLINALRCNDPDRYVAYFEML